MFVTIPGACRAGDLGPTEDEREQTDDDALLKNVHGLYAATYSNKTDNGLPLLISDRRRLLKYDVWVLLFAWTGLTNTPHWGVRVRKYWRSS